MEAGHAAATVDADAVAAAADCPASRRPPQRRRQWRRAVVDGVLGEEQCQELIWLLDALGHDGHSPHVSVVTTFEVAACAPLLLPALAAARRAAHEAAERALGAEMELYVEWSGLVAWRAGAAIGWHHDSNRPYLAQRAATAVLYLNAQGRGFAGGALEFGAGEPGRVAPAAGRLAAYSAGEEDAHRVAPVTRGRRATLALWFTRDEAHSEDAKILQLLRQWPARGPGLPASMWAPHAYGDGDGGGDSGGGEERGGSSSGSAAAAAAASAAAAADDVRAQRLRELGLAVRLPGGAEGPAELRWGPGSGEASSSGKGDGGGDVFVFDSLQQASLAAHWAAWRQQQQQQQQAPLEEISPAVEWSHAVLAEAARWLAAHLEAQRCALDGLLPAWRSAGFLLSPEEQG